MNKEIVKNLVLLRYVVGYLGEKNQYGWWASNFLNSTTKRMFEFTFPRTAHLAQYEAVSAAAAKIHDETIGVGKSFHIFRLPEFLEKLLVSEVQLAEGSSVFEDSIESKESAMEALCDLAESTNLDGEGPINLGQMDDSQMEQFITQIASAYFQAFNGNKRAFPYFKGYN